MRLPLLSSSSLTLVPEEMPQAHIKWKEQVAELLDRMFGGRFATMTDVTVNEQLEQDNRRLISQHSQAIKDLAQAHKRLDQKTKSQSTALRYTLRDGKCL